MENNLVITAEVTPNPNTLKFNVNRTLAEAGSFNFPDREKAHGTPLAEKLFTIKDVLGVMIGRDFVTITKAPAAGWQTLVRPISDTLQSLLALGQVILPQGTSRAASEASADSEIEKRIKEILNNEIRPAVAMDGGDITFYGYRDGVVTLHLQGSCSHCPSSVLTLKMGVENRLRSLIPEVREVVQI